MKNYLILLSLLAISIPLLGQYSAKKQKTAYIGTSLNTSLKGADLSNARSQLKGLMSISEATYNYKSLLFIEDRLELIYEELEEKKIAKKSINKAIELIDDVVKDAYLEYYKPTADLQSAFRKGEYNDITACAIYAMILDHYRIPFVIKHDLFHLYPVGDPYGFHVPIHITDVPTRSGQMQEQFVRDYLLLLENMSFLDGKMMQNNSVRNLFDDFYLSEREEVTVEQLPSIYYYRQALSAYQEGANKKALKYIEQAQLSYPSPRHKIIQFACMYQLAAKADPRDPDSYKNLFALYRIHPVAEVEEEVMNLFALVSDRYLFTINDLDGFELTYKQFAAQLRGKPELSRELKMIYYYQKAKYLARKSDYEQASLYTDSLYHIDPEDQDIQGVMAKLFGGNLRFERDFEKGLDQIEKIRSRYPSLIGTEGINDLELFYYAERVKHHFDHNDETKGVRYLKEFDKLLSQYGKTPKVHYWISTAYLASADFYVRRKNYSEARKLIERANVLAPDDAYLEHRQELMYFYPREK